MEINKEKELSKGIGIQRAYLEDVDKVWDIVREDAKWLEAQKGLDHWSSYYTREIMEEKIKKAEVYLYQEAGVPVATMTLDPSPVAYYTEEDLKNFSEPQARAIYISSVAVRPDFQGRGIASKLMEFADRTARERGIKYIRFDCRAEYEDLVNFYEKRGYQKVGNFSEGEKQNYFLMEKRVL